jgi:hypothetical protein
MANNLFANTPAACVAKQTTSFASAGLDASNINIIYEVGNPLKSWVPDRSINAITGFTADKGYYIVPKIDMDLTTYVAPPLPVGGGGGGDTTAPTVTAKTAIDATHINVTFSEAVNTAALAGFSFKKNGAALVPSAVAALSSSVWQFTLPTMLNTDTLLISYNSGTGGVQDLAGNPLASFTDSAVTNTIGVAFDPWNDIPWVQAYDSDRNMYLAGSPAVDGGNVDEWRDTKHAGALPNVWSFQQADTAKQPVLRSTGINSKKAIEALYDGTNAHQLSTDAHTGVPPTLTFVYINRLKEIPVAGYKILRSSAPDCNAYIHGDATGATGVLAVYGGAGPIDTSYSMLIDENIVIEEVWKSGGGVDVRVNGISVGTGIAAGTAPTVVKNLMGANDGTCAHFYRRHFFVLDREMTGTERTNMTNWLKADGGIA